jgi:hypothetical protein
MAAIMAGSLARRRQAMSALRLGLEIRDFDLDRMGFSLSVLDESKKRQSSEGYLRMTLEELGVFVKALKGADEVDISTVEPMGVAKLPTATPLKPDKRRIANLGREGEVDE